LPPKTAVGWEWFWVKLERNFSFLAKPRQTAWYSELALACNLNKTPVSPSLLEASIEFRSKTPFNPWYTVVRLRVHGRISNRPGNPALPSLRVLTAPHGRYEAYLHNHDPQAMSRSQRVY
ncbi:hypothetical protein E4U42_000417, partial [Claviceps africana]